MNHYQPLLNTVTPTYRRTSSRSDGYPTDTDRRASVPRSVPAGATVPKPAVTVLGNPLGIHRFAELKGQFMLESYVYMIIIYNIYIYISIWNILSKEVLKSNFQHYGQMKSRDGKSQRRGEEERRSKKRKSQNKEDTGARKGRKVAKHCVFPMICGSRGSKSRLA